MSAPSDYVIKAERSIGHEVLEQLLAQVRNAGKPWALYTEEEQARVIDTLRSVTHNAISYMTKAIVGGGRPTVECTVDAVTFKKQVRVSLSLSRGVAASELADRAGSKVVVVLMSPLDLIEGSHQVKPDKGQRDLLDDPPTAGTPEPGDDDDDE